MASRRNTRALVTIRNWSQLATSKVYFTYVPAHGREEAAPVVPHGEVDRGDLDAEEDAADGGAEAAGDADGARRRQHLAIPRLVGVDALEGGDQLAEQRRHDAGDVDEGTLLAQGHPAPQRGGQPHDLGQEGLAGEVLLEHDAPGEIIGFMILCSMSFIDL